MTVLEIVTFRLAEGTTEPEFRAAIAQTTRFLETCPGYRARRTGPAADGTWADVVEWASLDEALSAAARFNGVPGNAAFNASLAPGSVVMRHHMVEP